MLVSEYEHTTQAYANKNVLALFQPSALKRDKREVTVKWGACRLQHEGGYSEVYCPFCGLAVVEQLSGIRTAVQVCEAGVKQARGLSGGGHGQLGIRIAVQVCGTGVRLVWGGSSSEGEWRTRYGVR